MTEEQSRPEGAAPPEETAWNERMIAEFHERGGTLSGRFEGSPVLLLHHVGARSGAERVNPLVYQQVGEAFAVFASAAGRSRHPAWYHNLRAHPETDIEVAPDDHGVVTVAVRARECDGRDRATIWATQKERFPRFADYESSTDRTIPVLLLEPHQA